MSTMSLRARTDAGARLVALAERHADELAERAAEHDREATFPFEGVEALKESGFFAAPVPAEHGGLGVTSVHDLVVASSRLARGDASLAIGVNMHLVAVHNLVRRLHAAEATGNDRRAAALAGSLQALARDRVVMAAAISEPQQDLARPRTVAARTDSGWRVDGRKVFCTMSPAADVLYTAVTFLGDDGVDRYGYALVPTDAKGVEIHDDWDALGMRASGSHSVTFADVPLPASALRGGFPVGDTVAYLERNLTAGLFHAAASLGIAEAAHAVALEPLSRNGGAAGRGRILVAENAVDLATSRAVLGRAAGLIDDHYAANPRAERLDDEMTALFAETQAAKTFGADAAMRVVDRALALSGGAGYMAHHPLSRAYRDVRAAAFMHPLGANRAYEFLARVALGGEASLN
jgi:alkylation response protein AidB-like acyl-CoA dehydrogenase